MSTPAPATSYFIGEQLPSDWSAVNIVYSKMHYDMTGSYLNFKLAPGSQTFLETNIETFLQKLAHEDLTHGAPAPRSPAHSPRGSLDIDIDDRCYVVLELDEGLQWQFNAAGVGVTTKADYGDSNAQLRHRKKTAKGYEPLPNLAPGPGCTLIYFSVVSRAALEKEGFNYHIELAQVATSQPVKLLGVVLDPDITNTNLIPPIPPS